MAEDEMAGWHHRLVGHEFEQALGRVAGGGAERETSTRGGAVLSAG